jgi:soluble lytic murein transglycosylase-like protein
MWNREDDFNLEISEAARKWGIPAPAIKATIAKESGFDPGARRKDPTATSRGLMQLIETTARALGFVPSSFGDDDTRTGGLYDPGVSIELGTKNLAQLRRRYPGEGWDAIYAAYNSGRVRRNAAGLFINSRGLTTVEDHVVGFRKAADYFGLDWKERAGPPVPFDPVAD